MEAFEGQGERFSWDMVGHSGDGSEISLVDVRAFYSISDFMEHYLSHDLMPYHPHFVYRTHSETTHLKQGKRNIRCYREWWRTASFA